MKRLIAAMLVASSATAADLEPLPPEAPDSDTLRCLEIMASLMYSLDRMPMFANSLMVPGNRRLNVNAAARLSSAATSVVHLSNEYNDKCVPLLEAE